jgi:hypothetical protein
MYHFQIDGMDAGPQDAAAGMRHREKISARQGLDPMCEPDNK